MKITVYDIERIKNDSYTRYKYAKLLNKNVTFDTEDNAYDGFFISADHSLGNYYVKIKINGKDQDELVEVKEDTILTFPGVAEPEPLLGDMGMIGGKRRHKRKSKRKSKRKH